MTQEADLALVTWAEILSVMEAAFPRLGKYGHEPGTNAAKMLAALRDDALIAEVAERISDARIKYDVKTRAAWETIQNAKKKQQDALASIVDLVKSAAARPKVTQS